MNSQQIKSVGVCLFYATVSITITFFNRAVFYSYEFNFPNILSAAQMLFSVLFLTIFGGIFHQFQLPRLTWPNFRKQAWLSFFFLTNVPTGLAALTFLNIPMFSTLRRATTLIVMAVDFFWRHIRLPVIEVVSVLVMVVGAGIAGIGDLQFNVWGYFFAFLNCIFTAGFLVSSKKAKQDTKLSEVSLLFFPNLTSILFVLCFAYLFGEFDGLAEWPTEYLHSGGFWVCFLMSAVQAFVLNYATFLCSNYNSPLATSVTGQVKNIAQISLGLVWFGDVEYNPINLVGLLIGIVGSVWYAYIKYQQTSTRRPTPSPPIAAAAAIGDHEVPEGGKSAV